MHAFVCAVKFPYWGKSRRFSAKCDKMPECRWIILNMSLRYSLFIRPRHTKKTPLGIPSLLDLDGGIGTAYVYVYRLVNYFTNITTIRDLRAY